MNRTTRRTSAFTLALRAPLLAATAAAKPDIRLILPGQMREGAMGGDGKRYVRTSNTTRPAAEGVMFKRTYENVAVGCPARAILHMVNCPHVNGMAANDLRLRGDHVTIAEILRAAGYRTGFVGKWLFYGQLRARIH